MNASEIEHDIRARGKGHIKQNSKQTKCNTGHSFLEHNPGRKNILPTDKERVIPITHPIPLPPPSSQKFSAEDKAAYWPISLPEFKRLHQGRFYITVEANFRFKSKTNQDEPDLQMR